MRRLKTFLVVTVVFLVTSAVIVASAGMWALRRPLPQTTGELAAPGLFEPTRISRDQQSVPHITANSPSDLFYAQGFAQAQDRMFQLELARRAALGQVAELVGPQHTALANDTLARTLGFERIARAELAELTPAARSALQSFSDGVNAYLGGRSPENLDISLVVLGSVVQLPQLAPWEPVHSLAILKRHGWLTSANIDQELGRSAAYGVVRDERLVADLYPPYPHTWHEPVIQPADLPTPQPSPQKPPAGDTEHQSPSAWPVTGPPAPRRNVGPRTTSTEQAHLAMLKAHPDLVTKVQELITASRTVAAAVGQSHVVAIASKHTTSGAPMLLAEPHSTGAVPDAWYQVGLYCLQVTAECPYTVSGFAHPGIPGVFFGRNHQIAWGMSASNADVVDLFLERIRGDDVWREGQWQPLAVQDDTIAVAGSDPQKVQIRSTTHGPLLQTAAGAKLAAPNLAADSGLPDSLENTQLGVSLAWAGAQPSRTFDGLLALNRAGSWTEFNEAARQFDFPAPALTYADTAGRIAYQVPGRIPVRGSNNEPGKGDGTWPRAGWNPEWDWLGWRKFEELPKVLNPSSGLIVAANQQPAAVQNPISVDFDYGYRSDRITDLLTAQVRSGAQIDRATLLRVQEDLRDTFAEVLVPQLLEVPIANTPGLPKTAEQFTAPAVAELREWAQAGYHMRSDSAGAAYFAAVYSHLLRLTFGDEPGRNIHPDGSSRWAETLLRLYNQPKNQWWDNKETAMVVEQRDQILARALYDARLELTARLGLNPSSWQWGQLHRLHLRQEPLGAPQAAWWAQRLMNPPAVDVGGSHGTVRVAGWDAADVGDYTVTATGTARMLIDLGALDTQWWSGLLGVSGHRASRYSRDQFDSWRTGDLFPWVMSESARAESAEFVLTLNPKVDQNAPTTSSNR